MLGTRSQNITLTLLTYLIITLTLSSPAHADSFAQRGIADFGRHRLIRKRAPFPAAAKSTDAASDSNASGSDSNLAGSVPLVAIGAAAAPPSDGSGDDTASASASPSGGIGLPAVSVGLGASSSSSSVSSSSSSSASSSVSASISASVSASASSASVSASASVSSSSSSSSKSSSSSSSSSSTQEAAQTPVQAMTSTYTSTAIVPTPTSEQNGAANNTNSSLSTKSKTALITVLIVVAASVGGVAIIWTIFRKWKLGHSAKFDERLQPIDWQPTHGDDGDFRPHRNSGMSHRSGFGGYGATSERGSDQGHGNLQPIPDHDFTAGSSHLAPVGGYADLARGPSPQPYMQENLSRGPSLNAGNYNTGVPIHHQGSY